MPNFDKQLDYQLYERSHKPGSLCFQSFLFNDVALFKSFSFCLTLQFFCILFFCFTQLSPFFPGMQIQISRHFRRHFAQSSSLIDLMILYSVGQRAVFISHLGSTQRCYGAHLTNVSFPGAPLRTSLSLPFHLSGTDGFAYCPLFAFVLLHLSLSFSISGYIIPSFLVSSCGNNRLSSNLYPLNGQNCLGPSVWESFRSFAFDQHPQPFFVSCQFALSCQSLFLSLFLLLVANYLILPWTQMGN